MKKQNFTKIISWSVILGLFLGYVLVQSQIQIISFIIPIIILFVVFTLATVTYFMFKESRHHQTLLNNGRYDVLIKYMAKKHEQLNGKIGYRQQYLVGIANCYYRMGNFEESLNYLEKIVVDKMDNKIKAGYYSLISSNLYFLNQDLNRAEELISKSRQLLDMPESMLLQALIYVELNKKYDAMQLIEQYNKKANRKKYMFGIYTLMYIDEYTSNVCEKFLLGLYYRKIGDEEKSKEYFFKSANCNYKNYFSDISKELSKLYS